MLAERWTHSEGDLGEVQVRDTEVIVMINGRLPIRRRGDGQLQRCDAVPGTIWLCPHGVQEDMIHLYGEVQESIHLFLPALPLVQTVVREIDTDPDAIELKYLGGFRDPLIERIAWAIRAEMTDPAPAGKMLIGEGWLPLGTIAFECGFSSQAHFTRWFKQSVGTTPGGYASFSRDLAASSPVAGGMDSNTVEWETERHDRILSMSVSGEVNDHTTPKFEKAC